MPTAGRLAFGKAVSELVRRGLPLQRPTRTQNGLQVFDLPADSPPVSRKRFGRGRVGGRMTGFLLDVNVLIALMWPASRVTFAGPGLVRASGAPGLGNLSFYAGCFRATRFQPGVLPRCRHAARAIALLSAEYLKHRYHRFWSDEISFGEAVESFQGRLVGHRQVSDSYLLGLAIHKKGKLATMDQAVLALFPPKTAPTASVSKSSAKRAVLSR